MRKFLMGHIRRTIRYYPPLLAAGIWVRRISADLREIDVEMKLRWWNANYVGTHYGGSLYSMADPFYMLMLIHNLGRDYIVWDKAASIRFRKPGRGKVTAQFRISEAQLEEIRDKLKTQEKFEPVYRVEVKDESGEVVAVVEKVLYVRKK
jgi:hypothetical protein